MQTGLAQALVFARSTEPRPVVSRRAISLDELPWRRREPSPALAWTPPARPLGPLLVALTVAPLALRRVFPLTAFWTIMSAAVAAYYGNNNATLVTFLAVAFAAYSAVVHSRYRGAALLSMPLVTVLLIALSANMSPPIPARATPLLIFIPIMIVGDAVHRWAWRAGDSGARLRQAQAEHEAATRRALARERARLASELHDVVTHNVSVMVVQAGAARRVLSADPAEAIKALRAVESSGRTAMTELRHLLGLLSPPPGTDDAGGPARQRAVLVDAGSGPGGAADLAPQPGLDELRETMVGRVRSRRGRPSSCAIAGNTAGPTSRAGTGGRVPGGAGGADQRDQARGKAHRPKVRAPPMTTSRGWWSRSPTTGGRFPPLGRPLDAALPRGAGMGRLACGNGWRCTAASSPPHRGWVGAGGAGKDDPGATSRDTRGSDPAMSEAATAWRSAPRGHRRRPDAGPQRVPAHPERGRDRPLRPKQPTARKRSPPCFSTAPTLSSWTSGCRGWTGLRPPAASSHPNPDAGCRIIILTTFDLDQYVYAALTAGASGFLLKDTSPEQLVARGTHWSAPGDALLAPSITRRLIETVRPPHPARPVHSARRPVRP